MEILVLSPLPIPLSGLIGPGHAIKGDAIPCLDQSFIFQLGVVDVLLVRCFYFFACSVVVGI
jgi:hypothetical protein